MLRLRLLTLCTLLAAGLTVSSVADDLGQRQQSQRRGGDGPLRLVPDRPIGLDHIKLDLKVDVEHKKVDSVADITFHTKKPTKTVLLDAVNFKVKRVVLGESANAKELPFKHEKDKLVVELGEQWNAGRQGQLRVEYFVEKPRAGLHFFWPKPETPDAPKQVWSQGETVTNRHWIPCIDDPDARQTNRTVVTVQKGYEAISNGKLVSRTENPDGTVTFDWHQEIPHPAYLITLVVGEFDVVKDEWEGIPVTYYVPKGRLAEAKPTYGRTPEMLAYFSKVYGIRYPWIKYAQVTAYQFGGGMENTSATTMYEGVLRDQRTLLDSNADDFVSHELAHQWWGDMVTCRDWSHLWINEGSATYAEALWEEHVNGRDGYDYTIFQKANPAIQGGRNRSVMDRYYPHPDQMFDGRSYPKGGWILHMLRRKLGDEAFFRALAEFGKSFKFQSAETFDFRRSFERSTGRSLERFFYDWLERPGSPALTVSTEYKADDKIAEITIKQTQGADAFHIPIKLALYCAGASEPVVIEEEMTEKELKLRPSLPGELKRIDVDPDMAVLADIKETKSPQLWQAQLSAALPLRLRAVRHYAEGTPAEHREMLAETFRNEKHHAVKVALANVIGSGGETVGRDALLQGLADKDARIRRACVLNLGKFKNDDGAANAVRNIVVKGDPSYGVENAALETYAGTGREDAIELIKPYLGKASHRDNTTIAALNALAATRKAAVFDTLFDWAKPEHPSNCRAAARRGLTILAARGTLSDEQVNQVIQMFTETLEKEPGERTNVLTSLPGMGKLAAAALPAVEKLAKEESSWQGAAQNAARRLKAFAKPEEPKKK